MQKLIPLVVIVLGLGATAQAREKTPILHDLIVDTALVGAGLTADLWSTEYALARCSCREGNPFGDSRNSRLWLKAGTAAGVVTITYKLRKDGHPGWAKWTSRGAMVLQFGAVAWNIRKARGH